MGDRLLKIYLKDHLAGATAGLELALRSAGANEGTPLGEFLVRLADEIAEDREILTEIMDALDVPQDKVKNAMGWGAEKLGRLKPNGQLTGYSPLSRVVELEGLTVGVRGKQSLWENLTEAARVAFEDEVTRVA